MATLEPRACDHLAHLARISLTPDEADEFAEQLTDILSYMAMLSTVDIAGVEEFQHAIGQTSPRPDVPGEVLERDVALRAAAHVREGHVAVPKILEDA